MPPFSQRGNSLKLLDFARIRMWCVTSLLHHVNMVKSTAFGVINEKLAEFFTYRKNTALIVAEVFKIVSYTYQKYMYANLKGNE